MRRYFSSFISGMGSLLSLLAPIGGAVAPRTELEEIGNDFARVGADIQKGINAKERALKEPAPHADVVRKEEQLEFQGV
jgi:hypothetical protein